MRCADNARERARITRWLACAEDLTRSISAARLHYSFGHGADIAQCERNAHAALGLLDDRLTENQCLGQRWLAASEPGIAGFPYAALAPEARIDLHPYPALQAWIRDMRHRPGFVAMPGILDPALQAWRHAIRQSTRLA